MRKASGCFSVVIIAVCVLICSILVGKMLGSNNNGNNSSISQPSSAEGVTFENVPESEEIVLTITQDKLRDIIQNALDEKFPMTLASLSIHENGMVDTAGTLKKDSFMELANRQNSGLSKAQLFLLRFAPEELDFTAEFEASYRPASGKMALEPRSITVKDFSIPTSVIPAALTDKFSVSLNEFASKLGYQVKSVAIYEGYITLHIE